MRVAGNIKVLRLETGGCEADKLSCLSSECATLYNGVEQLRAKGPVPNGIAQNGAIPSPEMRYDRVRRVLRNGVGSFARGEFYRHGGRSCRSTQIIYVDEPELRAISISRKSELLCHF